MPSPNSKGRAVSRMSRPCTPARPSAGDATRRAQAMPSAERSICSLLLSQADVDNEFHPSKVGLKYARPHVVARDDHLLARQRLHKRQDPVEHQLLNDARIRFGLRHAAMVIG